MKKKIPSSQEIFKPQELLKGVFPDWLLEDMFKKRKHTKREEELAKLFAKRIKELGNE